MADELPGVGPPDVACSLAESPTVNVTDRRNGHSHYDRKGSTLPFLRSDDDAACITGSSGFYVRSVCPIALHSLCRVSVVSNERGRESAKVDPKLVYAYTFLPLPERLAARYLALGYLQRGIQWRDSRRLE